MASEESRFLEFGPFQFDMRNKRLTREGQLVPLTPKAADLLFALLNARGDVVSKDDLLRSVWVDTFVEEGNLGFHIHAIREALKEGGKGQRYIENVPRRGYRFAGPISEGIANGSDRNGAEPFPATTVSSPPAPPQESVVSRRGWLVPVLLTAAVATIAAAAAGAVVSHRFQPRHLRVTRYQQLTSDRREKDVGRPLVADVSSIYFPVARNEPLSAVAVSGGETHTVPEAFRDFAILDFHPARGEYLAMRREKAPAPFDQLWVLSSTGSARKVGTIACSDAAWSPDGRLIACTTDAALHVIAVNGTQSNRLVAVQGTPQWPRWSPDGRRLRFTVMSVVDRDPRFRIWQVGIDGEGLRMLPLSAPGSSDCCGTWTPDGEHFVFESRRDGRSDLWTLDEHTDLLGRTKYDLEPLTAGPLSFGMPGMSVDGTRIFVSAAPPHGELVRYDQSVKNFVPYLGGISALWIDFSRDGRSVVYVRSPEGTLWRANSDGSEPRELTRPGMKVDGSSWSPDGRQLAFRGSVADGPFRIFIMPADGGDPKAIIAEEHEQGIPTWSPDGNRLVFGGVPVGYGVGRGEVIQIYDLRSQQFSTVPGSTNLWTPRWSPDGRYIAAITISDRSLRLFDVAMQSWKAISNADHIDNQTWSRDSQYISYHTEGGLRFLRRVRVADGQVEEIADLKGFPMAAYWWSGLSLDGSPLVLRHLGGPEIYALELEDR